MIGGTKTPGQVQSLLGKGTIPLTILVRVLWLNQWPSSKQVGGALLIVAGAVASILPAWETAGGDADAGLAGSDIAFYCIFAFSCIPTAIGGVYVYSRSKQPHTPWPHTCAHAMGPRPCHCSCPPTRLHVLARACLCACAPVRRARPRLTAQPSVGSRQPVASSLRRQAEAGARGIKVGPGVNLTRQESRPTVRCAVCGARCGRYKEVALTTSAVDETYLNAWITLFQFALTVLCLPLNTLNLLGDEVSRSVRRSYEYQSATIGHLL